MPKAELKRNTRARAITINRSDVAALIKTNKRLRQMEQRFYKLQLAIRACTDIAEDLEYSIQDEQDVIACILDESLNPEVIKHAKVRGKG